MKPFRLAALLRLRAQRAAVLQQQHSELQRRRLDAIAEREAQSEERLRQDGRLAQLHSAPKFDVLAADQTWRFLNLLDQRLQQLAGQIADLEREIESARQALVDASRERRTLERLHERQQAVWRQEEQRRDNTAHESVAAARWVWERQRRVIGATEP